MGKTSYISSNGMIIGEMTSGTMRAYGPDALGSTVATYTGTSVENGYQYSPYGAVLAKTGTAVDPAFLWNGDGGYRATKLTNAEYYVRDRVFSSTSAQWTTVDRLWPSEGSYIYVNCTPVMAGDPSGMGPPGGGLGGSTPGVMGWATCYDDEDCASCVSTGITTSSKPLCICCTRWYYQTGPSQPIAAIKMSGSPFSCFDIVTATKMSWNKSTKQWVQKGPSVTVTVVDTGTLPTSSKDKGPDGIIYPRILDLRADSAKTLGYSCDNHTMVSVVKVGHAFPGGPICWHSYCVPQEDDRPQSECSTPTKPKACAVIADD